MPAPAPGRGRPPRSVDGAALLAAVLLLAVPRAAAAEAAARSFQLPDDFMIGAGSSAYQIEGGWNASGKGLSTLDRAYGGRADGGGNAACDSYRRYAEDVALLKLMGATHYRFSIAWTRLLPTGEADNVNPDGVRYYNALLDELEANGIEPVVTLYHEGTPAHLDDEFGGWLSPKMVDYFEAYAVTAFRLFGDRVRHWVTLNEPYMFCVFGVGHGRLGASKVWPGFGEYLCARHMLLGHARAFRAYKQRFAHQRGRVGLTLQNFFAKPCSAAPQDVQAAEAHQQFELGWFLEPLLRGEYPPLVRQRVDAARLPAFAPEDQLLLQGALDFLGLNIYFGVTACYGVPPGAADPSLERDAAFVLQDVADHFLPPGPFRSTPWAVRATLGWLRERYGTLSVVITENGFGDDGVEGLRDATRIAYLQDHLHEVLAAIHEDKHNVTGYLAWCLLDDFEWGAGYRLKFGLVHVDFKSGSLLRTPKDSLFFLKDVIERRRVPSSASGSASRAAALLVVLLSAALLC